jgi:hypothetical protein
LNPEAEQEETISMMQRRATETIEEMNEGDLRAPVAKIQV